MTAYDIIQKPLLTEKAYGGFANKKYIFKVDKRADKTQIKRAVEEIFKGAKVKSVNTVNVRGKYKAQGRTSGYTPDFKKAIVQLTEDSAPLKEFEGMS